MKEKHQTQKDEKFAVFWELILLEPEEGKIKQKQLLRGPTLLLFAEPGAARMAKEDDGAVWWGFTCRGTQL